MTSQLTPYLCVADARAAVEWYAAALGAEVTVEPYVMDDGRVGHCELAVDGAGWMLAEEFPEEGVAPPAPDRGSSVTLQMTVGDVDAVAARVEATGTPMVRGPEDSEHGRVAVFVDPFGHRWFLAQG